jgi:hypothetical protein
MFTLAGGGGIGAAKNVLEQPLAAQRRRRAVGIGAAHRDDRRLAEQPPPVLVGQRDTAEVAAVDAGNAIVPGELLVEERVLRGQEVDDAAVLGQLIAEKQLDLADERGAQVVVEPGEVPVDVRRQRPDVAGLEPLREEVVDEGRACALVGEHPADLPLEHGRVLQLPLFGRRQQLVVGNRAPEEERQP